MHAPPSTTVISTANEVDRLPFHDFKLSFLLWYPKQR